MKCSIFVQNKGWKEEERKEIKEGITRYTNSQNAIKGLDVISKSLVGTP